MAVDARTRAAISDFRADDFAEMERYIRAAAKARNLDPDTVVAIAKSEGMNAYAANAKFGSNLQSRQYKNGKREPSYGPYQLYTTGKNGGLGDQFVKETGLDLKDPMTIPDQIDWTLDWMAENKSTAPWYGAKREKIDTSKLFDNNPKAIGVGQTMFAEADWGMAMPTDPDHFVSMDEEIPSLLSEQDTVQLAQVSPNANLDQMEAIGFFTEFTPPSPSIGTTPVQNENNIPSGNVEAYSNFEPGAPLVRNDRIAEAGIAKTRKQKFDTSMEPYLVAHHTGPGRHTPEFWEGVYKDSGNPVHEMMGRDGTVYQTLPNTMAGSHVHGAARNRKEKFAFDGRKEGDSTPFGKEVWNKNSIGLEVMANNDGDITDDQKRDFPKWVQGQMSEFARRGMHLPVGNVVGHREVNSHKQTTEGKTLADIWRENHLPKYKPTAAPSWADHYRADQNYLDASGAAGATYDGDFAAPAVSGAPASNQPPERDIWAELADDSLVPFEDTAPAFKDAYQQPHSAFDAGRFGGSMENIDPALNADALMNLTSQQQPPSLVSNAEASVLTRGLQPDARQTIMDLRSLAPAPDEMEAEAAASVPTVPTVPEYPYGQSPMGGYGNATSRGIQRDENGAINDGWNGLTNEQVNEGLNPDLAFANSIRRANTTGTGFVTDPMFDAQSLANTVRFGLDNDSQFSSGLIQGVTNPAPLERSTPYERTSPVTRSVSANSVPSLSFTGETGSSTTPDRGGYQTVFAPTPPTASYIGSASNYGENYTPSVQTSPVVPSRTVESRVPTNTHDVLASEPPQSMVSDFGMGLGNIGMGIDLGQYGPSNQPGIPGPLGSVETMSALGGFDQINDEAQEARSALEKLRDPVTTQQKIVSALVKSGGSPVGTAAQLLLNPLVAKAQEHYKWNGTDGILGGLFGGLGGSPEPFSFTNGSFNPSSVAGTNRIQVNNYHTSPSESNYSVHSSPSGQQSVVSSGSAGGDSFNVTSPTSSGGTVTTTHNLGAGTSNPGGQAASKIVCTAMLNEYGFGSYRQKIWLLYSKKYTGPAHEVGYHAMFLPLIKWAYDDGKEWVRKPLEHVVRLRTVACEDIMKKRKRWHLGHLYNAFFCATCRVLGSAILFARKLQNQSTVKG